MASTKKENILKLMEGTVMKAAESLGGDISADAEQTTPSDAETTPKMIISNVASGAEVVDYIDDEMLKLLATISGEIYDEGFPNKLEKDLLNNKKGLKASFVDLKVRFIKKGVTIPGISSRLNPVTPFSAIITGSTLILAWRGTSSFMDLIADINFTPAKPFKGEYKDLAVQGSFYKKARGDLESKKNDIASYIKGKYMIDKTKKVINEPDGKKITRIILTGHSLGGGIAQVAHLELTVPDKDEKDSLASLIKEHGVEVHTVGFSAPTSIAPPAIYSNDTVSSFLEQKITPNMRNCIYSYDVIPRGYANLPYINDALNAMINGLSQDNSTILEIMARNFLRFHEKVLNNNATAYEELTSYQHIGRLVYYEDEEADAKSLVDPGFQNKGLKSTGRKENFYDLEFELKDDQIKAALFTHNAIVKGPGLSYEDKE